LGSETVRGTGDLKKGGATRGARVGGGNVQKTVPSRKEFSTVGQKKPALRGAGTREGGGTGGPNGRRVPWTAVPLQWG